MVTRDGGLELRLRRTLSAPRPPVFQALTDPRKLAMWWGPEGFTIPSVDTDLRPGGSYRIAMQPPDGDLFYLTGEFLEVVPPERLSYTFRWEDPDPEDRETTVSIALRDLAGASTGTSTELILVQRPFATERRRALHDEGWTQSLVKLAALLSSQPT